MAEIKGVKPTNDVERKFDEECTVEISNLDFRWESGLPFVLKDVNLKVKKGSRTLLIGSNGAGKSSMLRILAGRHFHSPWKVRVLGRPAFHDTSLQLEVALLGERWGYEACGDVTVTQLVKSCEGADMDRVNYLIDVLEIDWDWQIYRLSDGQRRRVQLLLGLARRNELLLLDEVTTDLDVVGRQNLLQFLKEESEQRGVTIIYATHIFDGLEHWASDIIYLTEGVITVNDTLEELPALNQLKAEGVPAPLFRLVESWLRVEFERRKELLKNKKKGDDNGWENFGTAERTMNTGFSRGSVIPTPNLNGPVENQSKPLTQAQKDRHDWQMKHTGTATVSTDNGEGCFTAGLPRFAAPSAPSDSTPSFGSNSRLGFNKTNPLNSR